MQTTFTAQQLNDPVINDADQILRRCVHCGLCTANCPTYVLLGDERDSPRGRIYLIKELLQSGAKPDGTFARHIDRCLSCLSCVTTCPSGVDYMHLVDIARNKLDAEYARGPGDRLSRWLIARVIPYPGRFKLALVAATLGRFVAPVFGWLGLKPLHAMLTLGTKGTGGRTEHRLPGTFPAQGERRQRVILLGGCAQQVLRPSINDATIRLLNRAGIEVVVPEDAGCCGALPLHMGREADGRKLARQVVASWSRVMKEGPVDAVVINASGCGTTVKDYGHLFGRELDLWQSATKISETTTDISEFLARVDLGAPKRWSSLKVAYHSACSMQHGQGITAEPRELLKNAGYAVAEIAEGHLCCGSAGTYNILQPELALQLRDRKIAHVEAVRPDIVATGNIGCIVQLQQATRIPVVHTVELLDWAYGGPTPRSLSALAGRVRDVDLAGLRS